MRESKGLTEEICTARAEALEEAAQHLELSWTDCSIEMAQGVIIATQLLKRAEKYREMAWERNQRNRHESE